ncbi:hypothetical protein CQW23_01080 [Capsicum baccatum]|uniref:Transposase MuDR plant domain-containing protein n=1 Tax=Capsicum baccatum TaxID=33114 RepID=A0A2G2XMJ9_CAPBA|nr:hypothetical protein CQW23_01080 [Capsicum baccatum]
MLIAEFILVSGDFMGEWVKTSKCWKWRSFTKVIIPIRIRRNSSYNEFIASVIQSGDLDCAPSDVVISYVMYSREKVNPTIINSDECVLTYIMDADADSFRPILRINVVERSFEGPLNSSAPSPRRPTVDDNLNDYENDVDDTINMEDYSMHMEDFSSDSQDDDEDLETESQAGHSFTDGTNFYCGQTFVDKKELKIQLDAAAARKSFDYYMEKSCTKLMKAQCLSRGCGWQKNTTPRTDFAYIICVNHFWDGKGPSIREIQRIVFKELRYNASYWMCWKGSVIAKNIIRGTPKHEYACLPAVTPQKMGPGASHGA